MPLTNSDRTRDQKRWWEIHDKDEYVCPDCGSQRGEIDGWEVHHIDRQPGKIVGLCRTCHRVRHGSRRRDLDLDVWKEEFAAIGGGPVTE